MTQIDTRQLHDCAEMCHHCADVCLETMVHCLDLGGAHAARSHQSLMLDCAAICTTSHGYMIRQSARHSHICRACAEICRLCAEDCRRLAGGDDLMIRCADVCEQCASSCSRMARG